jgi:ribosomal protein S18 acetylase RimI-like enzyme
VTTELCPLLDHGLQESVDLMNLGFSDYFIHIELTLPMFLNMARVESIDLGSSRVIYVDDEAVGVALISRRGWTSRLATMCLGPTSRGRGAGRAAMEVLLADASARRDHSMVLEVISDNAPAVHLYESCGFKTERRLVGFEGSFTEMNELAELEDVDIREVARLVIMHGLENLPWQISGESLAQAGPPSHAYRLDDAYIVISNPGAKQVAIRSIIVQPEARRQGQAARLIKAVVAQHPNKKWIVSALCPKEIGSLFEKIGFKRDTLSQFQMRIEINPPEEK